MVLFLSITFYNICYIVKNNFNKLINIFIPSCILTISLLQWFILYIEKDYFVVFGGYWYQRHTKTLFILCNSCILFLLPHIVFSSPTLFLVQVFLFYWKHNCTTCNVIYYLSFYFRTMFCYMSNMYLDIIWAATFRRLTSFSSWGCFDSCTVMFCYVWWMNAWHC